MKLLERHFEMAMAAPNGIKKLRELILQLAVRGRLVPQDERDHPQVSLKSDLSCLRKEKTRAP